MMLIHTAKTEEALAAVNWRSAAEQTHNCYDVDNETPGVAWLDARTGDIQFTEEMREIDGLVVLSIWESMELEDPSMGRRSNTPVKVVKFAFGSWVGVISQELQDRMTREVADYCSSAGW